MKWALVDYENVGSLEKLDLGKYNRVIVFCCSKHNKLKFHEVPSGEGCEIQLIKLTTNGPNNLDFHIAFHLGRLHERESDEVEFHIVSNDKDLNGMVSYLKSLGRRCRKVENKNPPRTKQANKHHTPGFHKFNNTLKVIRKSHRPASKPKLINAIRSHVRHLNPPGNPELIYAELLEFGLIEEEGAKIKYLPKPVRRQPFD